MGWSNRSIVSGGNGQNQPVRQCFNSEGGACVIDIHDERIEKGISYRVESVSLLLGSGVTTAWFGTTTDASIETWFRVVIEPTFKTTYRVYLEPSAATGTLDPVRSRNPHMQFIGAAPEASYIMHKEATGLTGPVIRERTWGTTTLGANKGSASIYIPDWTVLSPVQRLGFELESGEDDNYINITFFIEEVPGEILE